VDSLLITNQRGLVLTGFLDTLRMSDGIAAQSGANNVRALGSGGRVNRRGFAGALLLGVFIALSISIALNIYLPYHAGALSMDSWMEQGSSRWNFAQYAQSFAQADTPYRYGGVCMASGAVVTIALMALRASFFWWPLHPLGYAICGSWSTIQFWFVCLLAWIFKSLTLRYGGIKLFNRLRPLFLGLVIGEFGMAVLFVVLNILFKVAAPSFPWG